MYVPEIVITLSRSHNTNPCEVVCLLTYALIRPALSLMQLQAVYNDLSRLLD